MLPSLLLLSFVGSSYGDGADTCQSVKGWVLGMGADMPGGKSNAGDQAACCSTCQAHVRSVSNGILFLVQSLFAPDGHPSAPLRFLSSHRFLFIFRSLFSLLFHKHARTHTQPNQVGCKAWTFHTDTKVCYLHSAASGWFRRDGKLGRPSCTPRNGNWKLHKQARKK